MDEWGAAYFGSQERHRSRQFPLRGGDYGGAELRRPCLTKAHGLPGGETGEQGRGEHEAGGGDWLRGEVLGAWTWAVGVGVGQSDSGKIWETFTPGTADRLTGVGRGSRR